MEQLNNLNKMGSEADAHTTGITLYRQREKLQMSLQQRSLAQWASQFCICPLAMKSALDTLSIHWGQSSSGNSKRRMMDFNVSKSSDNAEVDPPMQTFPTEPEHNFP